MSMENKKTLALVMIVKNEELGLERAILSCKDFVDEIIIAIDNSTTDKTAEIAKKYATVVKFFDWRDDFAWARNFAHEGVKSDFILFLDGHEYVEKNPSLVEHLALDCDALLCTVEMENGTQFRNTRIYKNGVQFVGQVHECQVMKNIKLYIEFLVKHSRVGGQAQAAILERNAQRDEQTFRVMGKELKENPATIRASFHLGLYYEGRAQYKKAIKYFNHYLKYSKITPERWFVFFSRAMCQLALNKCFWAFWSASRADDEIVGRWEIAKLKGLILFQRGKFAKAAEALVESFKVNIGDQTYKPWKRDDAGTWNLIGECFFNLKNYYKAYIAFEESEKRNTDPMLKELAGKRAKLMYEMAKNLKVE